MRLSAAIRCGARLRPQGFFALFSGGQSCALGAALEALSLEFSHLGLGDLVVAYPWLLNHRTTCPVDGCWHAQDPITSIIADLNNTYRWTREAIADWVETVENELLGVQQPEAQAIEELVLA